MSRIPGSVTRVIFICFGAEIQLNSMQFSEIKDRLKVKTVGIAGCGGLGSNAAVALARVGVGKLIVVDFDLIEESNLNRQFYFSDQLGMQKVSALKENIQRINPAIHVEAHSVKLKPNDIVQLFKECDVILEAFDLAEMKEMIIETVLTELPEIPLISGVGMAGWGRNDRIRNEQHGRLHIVGDGVSEASEMHPPLAPRVGVVSNMMANVAMELLLGKELEDEDSPE
ncbi:MAG: sulfur carrier protein ThiS adenylyltransferase ThiF [bacterium]